MIHAVRRCAPRVVVLSLTIASTGCGADERSRSTSSPGEPVAAQRIVSLIPSVTEVLVALGVADRLVARTEADDAPVFAHLPSVGRVLTPDLETLAAVEPDLVIAWSGSDVSAMWQVVERRHGRLHTTSIDRLKDIGHVIGQVGSWIGEEESADLLRAEIGATLDSVRRTVAAEDTASILWVVWSTPIIVAGPDTFLHDLVAIVGGRNAAEEIGRPWPRVGWESLLHLDPDVLVWADGPGMFPASELHGRKGWELLRAVREGRVLTVDSESFQVPGPKIARAALGLARSLGEMQRK